MFSSEKKMISRSKVNRSRSTYPLTYVTLISRIMKVSLLQEERVSQRPAEAMVFAGRDSAPHPKARGADITLEMSSPNLVLPAIVSIAECHRSYQSRASESVTGCNMLPRASIDRLFPQNWPTSIVLHSIRSLFAGPAVPISPATRGSCAI